VRLIGLRHWPKTLALAAQLQPKARNLVLISGASEYDKRWEKDALRDLAPQLVRYNTRSLSGLPFQQLLEETSRLSTDAIVLMLPVVVDGSGEPRVPREVAAAVAKVSGAPLYSVFDHWVGEGIVGGYMNSYAEQGVAVADLVLPILAGKAPRRPSKAARCSASRQIPVRS
jgi:hypothetical protein